MGAATMEDLHLGCKSRGISTTQAASHHRRQEAFAASPTLRGHLLGGGRRARKLHGVMQPTLSMNMAIPLNIDSPMRAVHAQAYGQVPFQPWRISMRAAAMEDLHSSNRSGGISTTQAASHHRRQEAFAASPTIRGHLLGGGRRARKLHGVMRPTPSMNMAIPLNIDSPMRVVHVWWKVNPRRRPRLVIGEFVVRH
ncbi:hypothetical protein Dimus_033050 [Dionaea muscipula]